MADLFAYGPGIAGLVLLGFLALTVAPDLEREYSGFELVVWRSACALTVLFSTVATALLILLTFPEVLEMLP